MANSIKRKDKAFTPMELKFIDEYMQSGNITQSYINAGYKVKTKNAAGVQGWHLIRSPKIKEEIDRRLDAMKSESIASATEVMEYFSKVMRGEIKDQFGLEAPLSERTKAAQELAKRTVDIQNREEGKADAEVVIRLDWERDKREEE